MNRKQKDRNRLNPRQASGSDLDAPLDLDRVQLWHRRILDALEAGMDPGLIVAVLFFHWLQTLYIEGFLRTAPDPDRLPDLERGLTMWLRSRPSTSAPDHPLRIWMSEIHARIRDLYPRRILHQRDVNRHTQRLVDALDGGLMEAVQVDGHLRRWRREVFFLWWCLRSYLDHETAAAGAWSPDECRDHCDMAQDWIIERLEA